jgi:hypothetical protein
LGEFLNLFLKFYLKNFLFRFARPPQVFYGGEIKGESAMKDLDDIGTSVIHTFQVYNDGPWRSPYVEVFIGNLKNLMNFILLIYNFY